MIHVLPGMGADSTLYRNEWRTLEDCAFIDWPAYRGETTLRAIARSIVADAGIRDHDVVIGHSLGGMIGCEIATLRKLKGLVLVSGAKSREEINPLLAALHPLAPFTPFRLAQAVVRCLPGHLYEMFARSDPSFLRATCRAIFTWKGLEPERVRVHRIHGRRDRIIPLPQGVDRVVEGGHVIPLTHARECVEFVRSIL